MSLENVHDGGGLGVAVLQGVLVPWFQQYEPRTDHHGAPVIDLTEDSPRPSGPPDVG